MKFFEELERTNTVAAKELCKERIGARKAAFPSLGVKIIDLSLDLEYRQGKVEHEGHLRKTLDCYHDYKLDLFQRLLALKPIVNHVDSPINVAHEHSGDN